jgi:DNA-binding MarR family transcriptional regulator
MTELDIVELIAKVARLFAKRFFGPIASEAGFSVTEGLVLWKIYHAGAAKASEVASSLGLPPSTLTGVVDRLVTGGWILREADPTDRRALSLRAPQKLKDYMKASRKSVTKSLERTFKDLPPELMPRLSADLAAMLECLEAEEKAKR